MSSVKENVERTIKDSKSVKLLPEEWVQKMKSVRKSKEFLNKKKVYITCMKLRLVV